MLTLKLGTRSSDLALIQANMVIGRLKAVGNFNCKVKKIQSTGDQNTEQPLHELNVEGVFSKELDDALLNGSIDMAVHSLKDLPGKLHDDLTLIAIPERICSQDVLITKNKKTIKDLDQKSHIYTGSVRRRAQLLNYNNNFKVENIRGNLYTRLNKFENSNADAMILAAAGLIRLEKESYITQYLPLEIMLPIPCQGAIGVVIHKKNLNKFNFLKNINNHKAWMTCYVERILVKSLQVGCSTAFGAHAQILNQKMYLQTAFYKEDGSYKLAIDEYASLDELDDLGKRISDKLIQQGVEYLL